MRHILRMYTLAAVGLSFIVPRAVEAQATDSPPRHEAAGELAFVGVSGNASTNTFGASFESVHRPNPWLLRQQISFVRNKSEGELIAQSFLYAPRVERTLGARLSAFVDYQYFRDRFAGVAHRNKTTGGLSAKILEDARQTLAIDAGLGYLSERHLSGPDLSSGAWAANYSFRFKLSDSADLSDDAGIVGVFERAADWRVTHTAAATARLNGAFSLKVSNNIRFVNLPVTGFESTDMITSVALVAKLRSGR